MSGSRRIILCIVIYLAAVRALPVRADNARILGLSSRAGSMCGAMTALADDYTACYYNPALLSRAVADVKWLQAGLTYIHTMRDFRVDDAGGTSVRNDISTMGVSAGFIADLESMMGVRGLGIGFNVYVPGKTLLTVDIPMSPREYFFPLYDDAGRHMNAYGGIGYRVASWLYLGIGANFLLRLPDTVTHIIAYVDAGELADNPELIDQFAEEGEIPLGNSVDIRAGVNRELVLTGCVHAGLVLEPVDWFRAGFSFRDTLMAETEGSQYIYVTPVDENGEVVGELASRIPVIEVPVRYCMYFRPREFSLGLGFHAYRIALDLDLTFAMWSEYRGPNGQKPDPGFKNTWTPSAGVEVKPLGWLALRAGFAWRPSPAPVQRGETNYLDSDAWVYGAGLALFFGKVRIEGHAQYHRIEHRRIEKSGGLPDVSYGGSLWNVGAGMVLEI